VDRHEASGGEDVVHLSRARRHAGGEERDLGQWRQVEDHLAASGLDQGAVSRALAVLFSAASDWLVTASRTVARTTGLAARGLTAATYPLVLNMVPRSHAPVTAAGSSMTNAVASPAASARRDLPWRGRRTIR
jgi:hypothetical protein